MANQNSTRRSRSSSSFSHSDTGKTKIANHFLYLFHEGSRKSIKLFDGLVLGRTEGNENYPSDSLLSRKHCRFSVNKSTGTIEVTDLQSTNGSRINSIMLPQKPVPLRVGEVLEVGNQRFMLSDSQSRNPFLISNARQITEVREVGKEFSQPARPESAAPTSLERFYRLIWPANWSPAFSALAMFVSLFSLLGYVGVINRIHQISHPTVSMALLRGHFRHAFFYSAFSSLVLAFYWIHFQAPNWFSKSAAFFGSAFAFYVVLICLLMNQGAYFTLEAQRLNSACFEDSTHSQCARMAAEVITTKNPVYSKQVLRHMPEKHRLQLEKVIHEWNLQHKDNGKLAALESSDLR